jgi:excisionase family DNA binding protein
MAENKHGASETSPTLARGHRNMGGHVRRGSHRDSEINFFSIAEVAERFQVSTRTVRRWIVGGELVVHRVGNVVRVSEGDLRTFLALHRDG